MMSFSTNRMIVDGRKIRDEIKEELKEQINELSFTPKLVLVYVGSHPVIDTFVELKCAFGAGIGVDVEVSRLKADVTKQKLTDHVKKVAKSDVDGIVLQLPLPEKIDTQKVVNVIPHEKDPDVLSDEAFKNFMQDSSPIIPPVAASVREILERYAISVRGRNVVVVGRGKLVGKPVSLWLLRKGAAVTTLEKGDNLAQVLPAADIIISGVGKPHLITSELVKKGAILIDAGTSDVSGEAKGDIDPEAGEKAHLFSPVPGGVGPITVAMLFKNLMILIEDRIK